MLKVCFNISTFSLTNFLLVLVGIKLENPVLWFMIHLFVAEIIFWLVNKSFYQKSIKNIIYICLYVIYMIVSVIFDIPNWWYLSTSTFILGLLYTDIKKFLITDLRKKLYCITFLILYIFLLLINCFKFSIVNININYLNTLIYLILSPMLILVLLSLKYNNKFVNNKFLIQIGCISANIYLYHSCIKLIVLNLKILPFSNLAYFIMEVFVSTLFIFFLLRIHERSKK